MSAPIAKRLRMALRACPFGDEPLPEAAKARVDAFVALADREARAEVCDRWPEMLPDLVAVERRVGEIVGGRLVGALLDGSLARGFESED